jgi:CO/xanthine dehydrogenase Mo-binding subunit
MAVLPKFVGERMKRREKPALIQGLGQYVDDILMAGMPQPPVTLGVAHRSIPCVL